MEPAVTEHSPRAAGDAKSQFLNNLIFLAMAFLPVFASALMSTNGTLSYLSGSGFRFPVYSFCPFKIITGFDCPFCGMTRSFIDISHFDFKGAWQMNPAGYAVYFFCLYVAVTRGILLVKSELANSVFFKKAEKSVLVLCIALVLFRFLWQFIVLL